MLKIKVNCPVCNEKFTAEQIENHMIGFHHLSIDKRPFVQMIADLYRWIEKLSNQIAGNEQEENIQGTTED